LLRRRGGAWHDISSGTTYVNLDEIIAHLPEIGLDNPRQVLLHEFGHFGQSTNLPLNADDLPDLGAYLEREAEASLRGAAMAKDPTDVASLQRHAEGLRAAARATRP
jgi:hypothetical protein